jgi:hypothetical protein
MTAHVAVSLGLAGEGRATALADMIFDPLFETRGQAASGRLFLLVGGWALDHAHDIGLLRPSLNIEPIK